MKSIHLKVEDGQMGESFKGLLHTLDRSTVFLKLFQKHHPCQAQTETGDFPAVEEHSGQVIQGNLGIQDIQLFQVFHKDDVTDEYFWRDPVAVVCIED